MHRKTSSAKVGVDGRRVRKVGENRDARPFRCVRRPFTEGPPTHRWGTGIPQLFIPRQGRFVRIEYCKKSGCRAVREFELADIIPRTEASPSC